jgi:hypothetical protein
MDGETEDKFFIANEDFKFKEFNAESKQVCIFLQVQSLLSFGHCQVTITFT